MKTPIPILFLLIQQVTCFQSISPVLNNNKPTTATTTRSNCNRHYPSLSTSRWNQLSRPRQRTKQDCFQLNSLKTVVDEIANASQKQTIFVGGKGGVGKTTTSSALAVELAQRGNLKVLVVSTDPAHSLGDALDVDLRAGNGKPITMTDPITMGNLDAVEISAEAALQDFRESLAGFDVDRLASSLGVSADLLESLGLSEFSGLLNSPPPGLDELVALGNVMSESAQEYDVIVVDTAPTGHTLRLLALPQFLDGLLGKLIKLRMKLSGLTSTLQAFMGDSAAQERAQTIDNAMDKLEQFRKKIAMLETNLKDNSKTNFLVVTVPTKLAIDESKRLVTELKSQGIAVNNIVVNQCLGKSEDDSESEAIANYYNRRREGQQKWIGKIREAADHVSSSNEYQSNGSSSSPINVVELPFFDVELVGIPALGFVGGQHIANQQAFDHLIADSGNSEPKVVICGGKGGVGKTTTSSSLAVALAAKGHDVALISTDPAHSLGDAIDMDLRGGDLISCPLIGVPGDTGEGSLSVMEIDPTSALSEFKGVVDELVGGGGDLADGGSSKVKATLQELESIFDTLPAGTDEVVALAKVVNLIKKGKYDRIILDTAPTGHTLRMLSTPGFIADLIDRLLRIAEKVNSNSMIKMLVSSSAGGNMEQVEAAAASAKSRILKFQFDMFDLEDLFCNPDDTEFLIVTVATELAARESLRLLNDLTFEDPDSPVKVRNIVVNQVLQEDGGDVQTFLSHVGDGQRRALESLETALKTFPDSPPRITKVPYLDTEPRGVFGLKMLASELLGDE